MDILKVIFGTHELYDTDKVDFFEYEPMNRWPWLDNALQHHTGGMKIKDFLLQFFPPDHQIFADFGESYYYWNRVSKTPVQLEWEKRTGVDWYHNDGSYGENYQGGEYGDNR